MRKIPCPFTDAEGRRCPGRIVRVKAYKADLDWSENENGTWTLRTGLPRSRFHLVCSEGGNHSGYARPDDEQMAVYLDQLPEGLWEAMRGARTE